MLILRTLSDARAMHGFQIAESILETSGKVFMVEEGSLYPALQRLLGDGLVKPEWGRTEGNRRARYYTITARGRRRLEREIAEYRRTAKAISLILGADSLETGAA